MQAEKGLFNGAVIERGAGLRGIPGETESKSTAEVLKTLGIHKEQGRELQKVPFEKILEAAGSTRLGPVVDGKVLPAHPFDPVATPISAGVPVIVGYTRTERTVYEIDEPGFGKLDDAGLLERTRKLLGDSAPAVIESYLKKYPKATPYDVAVDIQTDAAAMNSINLAERRAALGKAPTFLYLFACETPVMGLRSPHTVEIPFVFNHIDVSESMVGPVTPQMRKLEADAAGGWAALARTGNPNHSGLPNWPAYTADKRATMIFDTPCRVENDPTSEVRTILEKRG